MRQLQRGERANTAGLRGLTFELTGPRRQDALARTERMYRVPQLGPRWPAVAGPVERGVRPRCIRPLRRRCCGFSVLAALRPGEPARTARARRWVGGASGARQALLWPTWLSLSHAPCPKRWLRSCAALTNYFREKLVFSLVRIPALCPGRKPSLCARPRQTDFEGLAGARRPSQLQPEAGR